MQTRPILRPNFEKRGGLVTVVVQRRNPDDSVGPILMVAYTDEAGFKETLETGRAVYWSTSRNERWCKGEKSGNFQIVRNILVDCDGDALIYMVEQQGDGACHTKAFSCFYRDITGYEREAAPQAGVKEQLPVIELPVHDDVAGLFG